MTTRVFVSVIAVLAVLAAGAEAKVWGQCELANKLLQSGISRDLLDEYMCIAWRESRYNDTWINTYNTDNSKDYGLFQINNRWWCETSESSQWNPRSNLCNVACDTVLNSVDETIKCIKQMYAKSNNTFEPWITDPYCKKEDMTQFTKDCDLKA